MMNVNRLKMISAVLSTAMVINSIMTFPVAAANGVPIADTPATDISITAEEESLKGVNDVNSVLTPLNASALSIALIENDGYEEGAYLKWSPYEKAVGYAAFVSDSNDEKSVWQPLDNELIREYSDYYRADALGLKTGEYYIKVQALDDKKVVIAEAVSSKLVVTGYDRSGFAWNNGKTASGAYNEDGTLKDNATVVYVTPENYNSVEAELTNSSGSKTKVRGFASILSKYTSYSKNPLNIRIIGNIKNMVCYTLNGAKGAVTIEGVGNDATINGGGIKIANSSNVEVRNLGIMNASYGENDSIGLDTSTNVWVHNCDLFYGKKGNDNDLDQVKGDGAIDCKKSDYVTFSYNHLWDNGKASLLGSGKSETVSFKKHITYHHNWFDHTDERNPRVRYFSAHIYNNYFDGVAKYASGSTCNSSLFVENNYYRNVKYPMMTSSQGSDMFAGGNTYDFNNRNFSGEDGGVIKAYGNNFTGEFTFVPYGKSKYVHNGEVLDFDLKDTDSTKNYDAYVASSKDEKVPETVVSLVGGKTYFNFDTESSMYKYSADAASEVPQKVMAHAGRIFGGDFWWNFDDKVDDRDNGRNEALSDALDTYEGSVISIGGVDSTAVSKHAEVSYKRYKRNPLSNTNGKVYNESCELISTDKDFTEVPDGYKRKIFKASDYIVNTLHISDTADSDRDMESGSYEDFITLTNYAVPEKTLGNIKLNQPADPKAAGTLKVKTDNEAELVIEAGTDQMEIHCDICLTDSNGDEIRERVNTTEIMHRAATTLRYTLPKAGEYTFSYPAAFTLPGSIRIYTVTLLEKDPDYVDNSEIEEIKHTQLPEGSGENPGGEEPGGEEPGGEEPGGEEPGENPGGENPSGSDTASELTISDNYVKGKLKTVSVKPVSGNSASENRVVINAGVKLIIEGITPGEAISINDLNGTLGTIKKNNTEKPAFTGGSIAKGVLKTKPIKNVPEQIYELETETIKMQIIVQNIGFDKALKNKKLDSTVSENVTLSANGVENRMSEMAWYVGKNVNPLVKGERTAVYKTKKIDSPIIAYVTLSKDGKSIKIEAIKEVKAALPITVVLHGKKYKTSFKLTGM